MRKLYTVTVEFEYAALAESPDEAKRYAHAAFHDVPIGYCAFAGEAVYLPSHDRTSTPIVRVPDDYDDDSLVYGADEDVTLAEAVEAEKQRLTREAQAKAKGGAA